MEKYVITGGPGAGKTTLINALRGLGYEIVPEAARMLIEMKSEVLPTTDFAAFQLRLLDLQLSLEQRIKSVPSFLDRGLPDVVAYCRQYGARVPERMMSVVKNSRYAGVFLLDPLPEYRKDNARWESAEQARMIHQHIHDFYKELGYDVVVVPVLEARERAEFVLKKTGGNGNGRKL